MSGKQVNSPSYWDARFNTDWASAGGPAQTRFFCDVAIRALPPWLANDIRANRLSICDWACAEGDAVDRLGEAFPEASLAGVDIAEAAIERARTRHPRFSFEALSELAADAAWDVVFCSNTLEHFDEPLVFLRDLLERARRYAIVLVPFREAPRSEEHLATFDYNSFPLRVGAFHLVHFRVIACAQMPRTQWRGEQLLVVFSRADQLDLEQYRLQALVQPMLTELAELRDGLATSERAQAESAARCRELQLKLEEVVKALAAAHASLGYRFEVRSRGLVRRVPGVRWVTRSLRKRRRG